MAATDFTIRFWGVRGSIACPGPDTMRYGGNTSCIEVWCGDRLMIFDAGTGMRPLGQELLKLGRPLDFDLFFTHTHIDHCGGLPFFAPADHPQNRLQIWAGHLKPDHDIKEVLSHMMMPPLFPVPIDILAAQITFTDFAPRSTLEPHEGVKVVTLPLNHPNEATGYRLEFGGKSFSYITDTEHRPDQLDANVLKLMHRADVAVYDSTYTDDEYPAHKNWGHSSWQEGVRLAQKAKVGQLILFHHDPDHSDTVMDRIAADAAKMRPGTSVAHEGLTLRL